MWHLIIPRQAPYVEGLVKKGASDLGMAKPLEAVEVSVAHVYLPALGHSAVLITACPAWESEVVFHAIDRHVPIAYCINPGLRLSCRRASRAFLRFFAAFGAGYCGSLLLLPRA